jgi:hypothetical protein
MKRSSWASGSGYVPSYSIGLAVAEHVERRVQPVGDALDRDLLLLHRLEQGGLGLRRRPVDLVGEQHVGEHRAGAEGEVALALVVEERAGDVGRAAGRG